MNHSEFGSGFVLKYVQTEFPTSILLAFAPDQKEHAALSLSDCVLIVRGNHFLTNAAIHLVRETLDLRHVLVSEDWNSWKDEIHHLDGMYVLNFFSDKILYGPILSRRTVSFHPSPPAYPGRGGASLALFDDSKEFGATAHSMKSKPDTGGILATRRFPISASDSCEEIFARAEMACFDLLHEIATYIRDQDGLPPPNGEKWLGRGTTRKEFEDWLTLDPDKHDEFKKKIRAARHSKYPGPYVVIHGHKFTLHDD